MTETPPSDIPLGEVPEIANLLDELESLAPITQARIVSYRTVTDTEVVNDALDEPEESFDPNEDQQDWLNWQGQQQLPFIQVIDPQTLIANPVGVIAVDCGLARLGETEDGLIVGLRGTIVSVVNGETTLNLYRTGPIYLRNADRLRILHLLGVGLNKPDIFVELNDNDQPIRIKSGVADDAQKYSDRLRNWFERILQRIAVRLISNGLVLLDGALTLNTRDTPTEFLRELDRLATQNGNALVGLSKQSRLQVAERSVRFWLSENPNAICYRRLSQIMSAEMRQRVLGNTYAIRFSPMGATFRVDIKAMQGQGDDEVIETMFSSCLIRGGYPDILVRAHTHSYFTSPSITELEAQCGVRYQLRPEQEIDLGSIFGPFGGRFK